MSFEFKPPTFSPTLPKEEQTKTVKELLSETTSDIKAEIESNKDDLVKESGFDTEKNKILKEYGGLESNVPVNSKYWKL